ncbi:hypothetical protein [Paenibacillus eucommiae]|uniref:Cell shape-determining protein MreC n=1 Tax=Paenibacillus eucommiae TaxID=1355755 RepID=A0ABS4IR80_9BACL|nr:hypothetical protein [Paenibacillus eucommiae]MBP1990079.1 cell shape-determining protein MreC [Paenibacillus eucommiae]
MGILTFISMLIIGSLFSFGVLLLFKSKVFPGILLLVLSVVAYIGYANIANTYFA